MQPPLTTELREAGKRIADQLNARLTFGDPFELRNAVMAFWAGLTLTSVRSFCRFTGKHGMQVWGKKTTSSRSCPPTVAT